MPLSPAGFAPTQSRHERDPAAAITVRVFNYANVADRVIAGAKRQAREVLSQVKVESEWLDCPTSLAEVKTNTACRGSAAPSQLVIRIAPRSQNPRDPLGFAALPKK